MIQYFKESGTLDRIRTTESIKTEGPNFYDHKTDPDDRICPKDQINSNHITYQIYSQGKSQGEMNYLLKSMKYSESCSTTAINRI